MENQERRQGGPGGDPAPTPGTLGEVLYAKPAAPLAAEREWVDLVRASARGSQAALAGLYERAHRPVFALALRITASRESAEEVTVDVFHQAWRGADAYDPGNGTVLGWIMNLARSRALDRLRHEHRRKRSLPLAGDEILPQEAPDPGELLEAREQGSALRAALAVLTPDERQVVQAAFFLGLTHAEVAERMSEPLGTVKTRIRSGLRRLRVELEARRTEP